MFLNLLNEEEKHNYLNLAVIAAHTNGSLEEDEKDLIKVYQREMGISDPVLDTDWSVYSEESAFHFFSASEKSHKKIVLFEIIGLLMCDSSFDEAEKRFVFRLSEAIGLSAAEVDSVSQLASQYLNLVIEIADNIFVQ